MVIYKTTNLVNGKEYIGKDKNNSPYYLGSGTYLKKAIKKYGRKNFKKEILEVCSTHEELKQREEYWLNYYDAGNNPKFYNMHNYSYGRSSHSEEEKQKLRELNSGKNHPQYGKPKSEETKRKLSIAHRSNHENGKKYGMYGKNHSFESIEKIKEKRKLQIFSDETKQKLSEAKRGHHKSDEHKKKISESIKKWHSERNNSIIE